MHIYGIWHVSTVTYYIALSVFTWKRPRKFVKVVNVMKTLGFFLWFRMYQDAEMILTKDSTSSTPGKPIKSQKQGEENKNLLDISPSDIVFYVGGYPANFTVSSQTLHQSSICLITGNKVCNTKILLTSMGFVNTSLLFCFSSATKFSQLPQVQGLHWVLLL